MANPKIDSIQFSGSTTKYDINLPTNATPSIAGLTVNGDSNFNGDVNISPNSVGMSSKLTAPLIYGDNTNGLSLTNYKGSGAGAPDGASIELDGMGGIILRADDGIILNTSESQSGIDIKAADELNLSSIISQVNVKLGNNTISFPQGKAGTIALTSDVDKKQDKLVSGTNIRTLNNASLLGSGNLNTLKMTALYTGDTIQGAKFFGPSTYPTEHFTVLFDEFSVNQNEVYNKRVPFNSNSSFKYPPTVIITPVLDSTTDTREVIWHLVSVDKNGFNFSVACKNTSMKVVSIHYIAIGEAN